MSARSASHSWVQAPDTCQWSMSGPKLDGAATGSPVRAAVVSMVCRAQPAKKRSSTSSANSSARAEWTTAAAGSPSARRSPLRYDTPAKERRRADSGRQCAHPFFVVRRCLVVAGVGRGETQVSQGQKLGIEVAGLDGQIVGSSCPHRGHGHRRRACGMTTAIASCAAHPSVGSPRASASANACSQRCSAVASSPRGHPKLAAIPRSRATKWMLHLAGEAERLVDEAHQVDSAGGGRRDGQARWSAGADSHPVHPSSGTRGRAGCRRGGRRSDAARCPGEG